MKNNPILLASPHLSRKGWEKFHINEALDNNWIAPVGENLDRFETELCEVVGAPFGVAVSSGTAAIHLALKSCGVRAGDKVICSTFTFVASCNPILYEKAMPIFVDSEPETWNMDPVALEAALTENPEVKAVVLVHLYGVPAKLAEIIAICQKFRVPLIEDAAESLGSTYRGQMTGTFGEVGIYSFNGNKIITTSGGGMLVTASQQVASKAKFWSTQSREQTPYYEHHEIGYNYRMSNISAGIGRGQLHVLQERIDKKRAINRLYRDLLEDLPEISFLTSPTDSYSNYWLTCVLFDKLNPKKVAQALQADHIESRPLWKPMHQQPVFKRFPYYGNKLSDKLFARGLCLPSDTKMRDKDVLRVANIIRQTILKERGETVENITSGHYFQYN